jgi:hypothetical protein
LLAQRDFEKAVEMLLKIRQSSSIAKAAITTATRSNVKLGQQLIYKQKETELINILLKDLTSSKERGNSKRVVNSLIKLKIYDDEVKIKTIAKISVLSSRLKALNKIIQKISVKNLNRLKSYLFF